MQDIERITKLLDTLAQCIVEITKSLTCNIASIKFLHTRIEEVEQTLAGMEGAEDLRKIVDSQTMQ